jgi:hypothetical protein
MVGCLDYKFKILGDLCTFSCYAYVFPLTYTISPGIPKNVYNLFCGSYRWLSLLSLLKKFSTGCADTRWFHDTLFSSYELSFYISNHHTETCFISDSCLSILTFIRALILLHIILVLGDSQLLILINLKKTAAFFSFQIPIFI